MSGAAGGYFNVGIPLVVFGITITFVVIAVLDLVCELKGWPPVGRRGQVWAHRSPLLAMALLVLLGALLQHFFWHDIVFDPRAGH